MTTAGEAIVAGGTAPELRARVQRYYDETQVLYSRIWSPTGVHYGFWDVGVRSRADAIRAMDRYVGRELGLPKGSRVLDAGCGIGGTSIFLAEEFDHRVLGITLSPRQLVRAEAASRVCKAPEAPRFEIRDYVATGLDDASFDGIFAVESVCHAEDKGAFLREAYRLLRPGGRLVVLDGFLARLPTGRFEEAHRHFLEGLALPNLATTDGFVSAMEDSGFTDIRAVDRREAILPSARSIWRLSWAGYFVCMLPCRAGIFPASWLAHGQAGISQRVLFESGVYDYRACSATKPPRDSRT